MGLYLSFCSKFSSLLVSSSYFFPADKLVRTLQLIADNTVVIICYSFYLFIYFYQYEILVVIL
jgi:hypothetical protein